MQMRAMTLILILVALGYCRFFPGAWPLAGDCRRALQYAQPAFAAGLLRLLQRNMVHSTGNGAAIAVGAR